MKHYLLLIALFVLSGAFSTGFAQQNRTLYFDSNGKSTTQSQAHFYSIVAVEKKDTTLYQVSSFFKNGSRMAAEAFKGRQYPIKWEKMHEFAFSDAVRQGQQEEYFENGKVKFSGSFSNGVGEGKHRRYYDSGNLLSEITLLNGREEGKSITYFKNGNKQTEYITKNGNMDGDYIEYQEDGKRKSKTVFHYGELLELIRYDAEGKELPKK